MSTLTEMREALETLEQDARRYRWLRDKSGWDVTWQIPNLDESIDDAMAAETTRLANAARAKT